MATSKLSYDAHALSPQRFQGLEPRKSAHFGYSCYFENANEAKESQYAEYSEVRDNHEYVGPTSTDKGLEIGFPAILDHQVGYENAEKPKLNISWNQIRFGNASEEQSKPNYSYTINKPIPHGNQYSKIERQRIKRKGE